jgi:hypothetical protein
MARSRSKSPDTNNVLDSIMKEEESESGEAKEQEPEQQPVLTDTLDLTASERRSLHDEDDADDDEEHSPRRRRRLRRSRSEEHSEERPRSSSRGDRSDRNCSELGKREREAIKRYSSKAEKQLRLLERSVDVLRERGIKAPTGTSRTDADERATQREKGKEHAHARDKDEQDRPRKRVRETETNDASEGSGDEDHAAKEAVGEEPIDGDAEMRESGEDEREAEMRESGEDEREAEMRESGEDEREPRSHSRSPSRSRSRSSSSTAGDLDAVYVHVKAASVAVVDKAKEIGVWALGTFLNDRRTDIERMLQCGDTVYLVIGVVGAGEFTAVARVLKAITHELFVVEFVSLRSVPFQLFYPRGELDLRRNGYTPIGRYTNPGQKMPESLGATVLRVSRSSKPFRDYEIPVWESNIPAPQPRSGRSESEATSAALSLKNGQGIRYFVLRCPERRFRDCYRDGIWELGSTPFRRLCNVFHGGNTCILVVVLEGDRAFHAYGYLESCDTVRMKISWSHRNSLSFSKFPVNCKVMQAVGLEPMEIVSRHGEAICSYMRNPDRGLDVEYIRGYIMLRPKALQRSASPRRSHRGRGGRGTRPGSPPRSRGTRPGSPSRASMPDPLNMSYEEYCDRVRRAAAQRGMIVERLSTSRPPVVRSRYDDRPYDSSRYKRDHHTQRSEEPRRGEYRRERDRPSSSSRYRR